MDLRALPLRTKLFDLTDRQLKINYRATKTKKRRSIIGGDEPTFRHEANLITASRHQNLSSMQVLVPPNSKSLIWHLLLLLVLSLIVAVYSTESIQSCVSRHNWRSATNIFQRILESVGLICRHISNICHINICYSRQQLQYFICIRGSLSGVALRHSWNASSSTAAHDLWPRDFKRR